MGYGVATVTFVDLVRWERSPFGRKLVPLARVPLRGLSKVPPEKAVTWGR